MGSKGKEISSTDFGLLDKYNKAAQQTNINDFFFMKPKDVNELEIEAKEKETDWASMQGGSQKQEIVDVEMNSQNSYCEDNPLPMAVLAPRLQFFEDKGGEELA